MERKIELAQAKSNYWKWHRGDRKGGNGKEEETEVRLQRLKEEITALEEEKDITPMNEEGGKEEIVMVVTSDGVRGAEVNEDSGDMV